MNRSVAVAGSCLLLAAVGAGALFATRAESGDGFQIAVGKLVVVAERHRISAPGFPNTGMNPFRQMPAHRFRLRLAGHPFAAQPAGAQAGGFSFNMVYVLADAPQPALLVPNGELQLLLPQGGDVRVQTLEAMAQPVALLQWLDGEAGQPGATFSPRLALQTPESIRLRGGRWLLLNRTTVLDVRTLRHYPVRPWLASDSDQPMAGLNASTQPALAFSPGGTQYATLGSGMVITDERRPDLALLVIDIPSGRAYGVAIPPELWADAEANRVDGAWIRRHFAWRDTGESERLERIAGPR